jgi:hypothetical protein
MEIWTCRHGENGDIKRKTEAQAILPSRYAFTICSSCKRKFVVCPFVDKETNGSYPFASTINGLAHLWPAYTRIYLSYMGTPVRLCEWLDV